MNKNRQMALIKNKKHYSGPICKRCNSTKKFTSNYGCVFCCNKYFNPKRKLANKKWKLSKKYGLTIEKYNDVIKEQDNKCFICKIDGVTCQNGTLVIDHDHKLNLFRSLLCDRCNKVLGFIEKNNNPLEYINKLYSYIVLFSNQIL